LAYASPLNVCISYHTPHTSRPSPGAPLPAATATTPSATRLQKWRVAAAAAAAVFGGCACAAFADDRSRLTQIFLSPLSHCCCLVAFLSLHPKRKKARRRSL
jgi:hypothetical protein